MLSPDSPSAGFLPSVTQDARALYSRHISGASTTSPFWDSVVLTASSTRQADRYRREIESRLAHGFLPPGTQYTVMPDPGGRRVGSGGATLHALYQLQEAAGANGLDGQRILMIHSGGDSRRLPQYSLSGKLFSPLPLRSPWGDASTLFDEFLTLSALWARAMPPGLLVSSGDVLLVFDPASIRWPKTGVHGVAMRQSPEVGSHHGVYILGPESSVYGFLQKPSLTEVRAAGGELPSGEVAVDTGLLHFDSGLTGRLADVGAEADWSTAPAVDLYMDFTRALVSPWRPAPEDGPLLGRLAKALRRLPFTASLVEGEFTHIGATPLFRQLMTEDSGLTRVYAAHLRLGSSTSPGVRSSGVIVDSVLAKAQIDAGSVVLECCLPDPLHVAACSMAHGLEHIGEPVEVPENTVLHQIPVRLDDGRRGVVLRVYAVTDNPKELWTGGQASWFSRPLAETLEALHLTPAEVWPSTPEPARCLWNAELFPVSQAPEAWACARWMLGLPSPFDAAAWRALPRLSLADSSDHADELALLESRTRRERARWEAIAVHLALDGADVRPMLSQSPGLASLATVATQLAREGTERAPAKPAEAAGLCYQSGQFFSQAGLEAEAEIERARAFSLVATAVRTGLPKRPASAARWLHTECRTAAPARIDLGGGWSDTPPFCLDWGGTVLNAAVRLNGADPIAANVRRTTEPHIRCFDSQGASALYTTTDDLYAPPQPGDSFAIVRAVLQLGGWFTGAPSLQTALQTMGGGLEIHTAVRLPMGSGLGTSSILAAALIQALHSLTGEPRDPQAIVDQVLELEQLMSTGGGWQDQAGGVLPGIKLLSSGPGLRQRVHAQGLILDTQRLLELESQLVLAWTGITRVARGLLQQVVGRYLARETRAVEVLHSLKTLALEMSHALQLGDWDYLGDLLDRHWALNQILDPNSTNAPIETMLATLRPHLRGAKLAGAGGGGYLMLLAKSPEDASHIRRLLEERFAAQGATCERWSLSQTGLSVECH